MEAIHNLEVKVAEWYRSLPHLPKSGQKWLADNVWWIALVSLVLGVLALIPLLFGALFAGAVVTGMGGGYGLFGATAGYALGSMIFLVILISIALLIVDVVLTGMAISPLKDHKKRGWDLLFIVMLVNAVSTMVTNVLSFNLGGLVFGVLWIAVVTYFLFEIRSYFGKVVVVKAKK